MYDEKLIMSFMTKLGRLANKYDCEMCDFDEVFSEGQLYLLDYMRTHKNEPINEHNLYCSVDCRLKTFVTNKKKEEENVIPIGIVIIDEVHTSDSFDSFLALIKSVLNEREFDIITKSFGIYTSKATLADIAKEYNLSVNRISQIRKRALVKIRRELSRRNILCPEDLF